MNSHTAGYKRPNQTYKAMMVFYILLKMTDKDHPIQSAEIKEILNAFGIEAETLSIQRDIKNLRYLLDGEAFDADMLLDALQLRMSNEEDEYSLDYDEDLYAELLNPKYSVVYDASKRRGFKLDKRPYSTNDLWLLIEAINGLKTISAETSEHLKQVVLSLANIYEIDPLSVETFVPEKHEASRDTILHNIPVINEAITHNKQISFVYKRYTFEGKKIELQPGKTRRTASPIRLIYNNGLYYLMCFVHSRKKTEERLYRIDKMDLIEVLEDDRVEEVFTEEINLEEYAKRSFNMFKGKRTKVRIRFTDDMLDTIVERFDINDPEVQYSRYDDKHFTVYAPIEVSDQFYSWICGFRKKARIITPAHVVNDFMKYLEDISSKYVE